MKCSRCKQWIHPGFEVAYRQQYYHSGCAVEQIATDKLDDQKLIDQRETEAAERAHKARKAFRLIIGGKK